MSAPTEEEAELEAITPATAEVLVVLPIQVVELLPSKAATAQIKWLLPWAEAAVRRQVMQMPEPIVLLKPVVMEPMAAGTAGTAEQATPTAITSEVLREPVVVEVGEAVQPTALVEQEPMAK